MHRPSGNRQACPACRDFLPRVEGTFDAWVDWIGSTVTRGPGGSDVTAAIHDEFRVTAATAV